ncbi:MAG: penicillin acylase family protein [Pseudomonadota bacterium]
MALFLRLGLRLLGVLGLCLLVAGAIGWFLISRSLPDYDGKIRLDGLEAPARVVRDSNAVPHIRAESTRDAWFLLGAMHAQDRLWQMELSRRAAQGRLSAYFGERTVTLDRLVKTLDLYGLASRSRAHQTEEALAALDSYAQGVNAWIRHINAEARGRGAPEFFVYGDAITPWTPVDSLAILKMMALNLSQAARSEVRRGQFQLALPPERVADILPDYPKPAQITAPRFSSTMPDLFPDAVFPRIARAEPAAAMPELGGASNAWAVDGTRTSSGKPLLANDPHLWLQAPSLWYLADIRGGEIDAIGGTMPGLPAILVGHNGQVAWGLTTTGADDQDLFIERLHPEDPNRYLTPDGWRAFESRSIRIDVAGQPALSETVRKSRHGPVLTGTQFGADKITPEGHVAALAWTALSPRDRTFSAMYRLMQSERISDAVKAAEAVVAPAQNLTLADQDGVGMITAGALPRRNPASRSQGRIPSPGWVATADWQGLRPAAENPRILRPVEGAVANANNRITEAPFPDHITFDWSYPYRIQRLLKELSGRAFHSRDSFVALQNDTVSEMARSVLPLIARDLWWSDTPPKATKKAIALELLREWTGEMNQHMPEPLIFAEWMRALTRRLVLDELGPLHEEVVGPRPLFVERVFRDIDGASVWCDVNKTPETETCGEIAEAALDDALETLERQYGRQIEAWRWGVAHRAVHRHQPFGFAGPLRFLFNIEHETSGGNFTLMRGLSTGRAPFPFENVHAAGLRVVFDLGDFDRSVMMISTGQSGHPFSQWYDYLAGAWSRGDVIPMSQHDDDAAAGAVGTLSILPGTVNGN